MSVIITHTVKALRLFTFVYLLAALSSPAYGQSQGDYRSVRTGNWNGTNVWQEYDGGYWHNVTSYPGQSECAGNVEIQNGHTITVTQSVPYSIESLTINGGNQSSYLAFNSDVTLTVTGETYLYSNSSGDEKSVCVDAGIFTTGSVSVNSSGSSSSRDAYIRISSGTATVTGNISLNSNSNKTYILFTGSGSLYAGGAISGGNITSQTGGGYNSPTSGTVIYNGSSSQEIADYTYYNLTTDNSEGFSLGSDITVNNQLTMTAGNINTGSHVLYVDDDQESAIVHTSGTVIGMINRAISNTGTDYLFPVGTVSYYRPAVMNFTSLSSPASVTAQFVESSPDNFIPYSDDGETLTSAFTEGYWNFSSSTSPTSNNYSVALTADEFESLTFDSYARITGRDHSNSTWRAIGTAGSVSGNTVSRTGITNRLNTTSFDYAIATCYSAVALGYNYERNITIDHSLVSGEEDLYNFPLMVSLTGEDFLKTEPSGDIYNSNGYDIIFTDESYNQLDHQIEYYSGTNGDLIAWVRIPVLSVSSNTVIKIIYGNSQITDDPSVATVWDSHYKGVWHLDDNNLEDFTSYDFAGTPYNTPGYSDGVINNSMTLNGYNEYMQVNNAPHLNFAGNITVSAWVYMDTGNRDQKIASNQNNTNGGYKFGIYTNNKVEFEIRTASNTSYLNRDVSGGTTLSTGHWYYLAGVSSDVLDSIRTFVNGVSERPFRKEGTLGTGSNTLVVGKEPFQSSYYFDGRFDELRISDEVRSDGWIMTEYNNQYSPDTFYSIDESGTTTNNLPSQSICDGSVTLTFGYPAGGTYSGNSYISGDIFTPPVPGTYTITYTYVGGCGPSIITKDIIVTGKPDPPVVSDMEYCYTQIANLTAVGENIKWYYNGSLVSTANPYSTGQTTPGEYEYTVTQTVNGCESDPASVTLGIYSGVTITTQPQSVSTCEGVDAVISVAATGYQKTYQWQMNGTNISDGSQYSGTNTPSLTIIAPGTSLSGNSYRCIISTTCGSQVTSNTATLTVITQPVATFSYTGSPYCPGAADPYPTFSGGGVAGTFTSTTGLVFVSTATGQIDISESIPGVYTVTNTVAASDGCSEAVATSTVEIVSSFTWTGAANTDWNETGNWSCGSLPTRYISVVIPNVSNKPLLGSGDQGEIKDLTIESGSSLTVSSNTLSVYGTVICSNGLDVSDGTIEFKGEEAQTIYGTAFYGSTVKNLTVDNSAGVTLLDDLNVSGIVYIPDGTLVSDGHLTLLSDGSGTALIDGSGSGTVSGNVTMQRYLSSEFGYKYFSSPFQAATVSEFSDDMDLGSDFPMFYMYDENQTYSGWVSYITESDILNPLEGYAANFGSSATAGTVDITGEVNDGCLSVSLYNHNNTYTQGFNLAGNPYPSPVDWNATGWTKVNIDDAVYYFNASTTDEYSGTYSSYVNGVSSDGTASNIIPSMQGFFVHVSDGVYPVTGTLGVSNSIRINDLTTPFLKSAEVSDRFLVRLTAAFTNDNLSADPTVIYFDELAETTFDPELDALKLFNTDALVTNLYSVLDDNKKLSVNALPTQADSVIFVPLGLMCYYDGEVCFKISDIENIPEGMNIYLYDTETETNTSLLNSGEYKVNISYGTYNDRFILTFQKTLTDVNKLLTGEGIFNAYRTGGFVRAEVLAIKGNEGLITIYDLNGNALFRMKVYDTGLYDLPVNVRQGIYLVQYTSGILCHTVKMIIGL